MKIKEIPRATVNRIPLYIRSLEEFQTRGIEIVSSKELAKALGTNAAQVRKDLSYIGEFGTRGIGYEIEKLKKVLNDFMGMRKPKKVILVGVGRLGSALMGYEGFSAKGFYIEDVFDVDKKKIGKELSGVKIKDISKMKEVLKEKNIDIGIITTPASKAQEAYDIMTESGVKSVLNFAPTNLMETYGKIAVRNVDLAIELQILTYYRFLKEKKKKVK